jgi:hypothetical protein
VIDYMLENLKHIEEDMNAVRVVPGCAAWAAHYRGCLGRAVCAGFGIIGTSKSRSRRPSEAQQTPTRGFAASRARGAHPRYS